MLRRMTRKRDPGYIIRTLGKNILGQINNRSFKKIIRERTRIKMQHMKLNPLLVRASTCVKSIQNSSLTLMQVKNGQISWAMAIKPIKGPPSTPFSNGNKDASRAKSKRDRDLRNRKAGTLKPSSSLLPIQSTLLKIYMSRSSPFATYRVITAIYSAVPLSFIRRALNQ